MQPGVGRRLLQHVHRLGQALAGGGGLTHGLTGSQATRLAVAIASSAPATWRRLKQDMAFGGQLRSTGRGRARRAGRCPSRWWGLRKKHDGSSGEIREPRLAPQCDYHSVKASQNPDYLRAVAQAVTEFRTALEEFLKLHVENPVARGIAPAVLPIDAADPAEVERLRAKVDLAAGRAMHAAPLTGVYVWVNGAGQIDAITAWQSMTRPKPLLESVDVLGSVDQMLGRLEALILKAEAEAPPKVGTAGMHPLIWGAAGPLWRDGHHRQAVAAAAEALIAAVKGRTDRRDIPDTSVWQMAFSEKDPIAGDPRLRWPGNQLAQDVANMNKGLRLFAPGVQMTIRNSAAHANVDVDEQGGLERLATLSLLARWADECQLVEAPE